MADRRETDDRTARPGGMDRRPVTAPSADELHDLQLRFAEYDADGDQRIGFAEFEQLLAGMGAEPEADARRAAFDRIDVNHDGAIDVGEFIDWWSRRPF